MIKKNSSLFISLICLLILLFSINTFSVPEPDTTTLTLLFGSGSGGTWNACGPWDCEIIYNDGTYHMWFTATSSMTGGHENQIGYATSINGVNWSNFQQVYEKPGTDSTSWAPSVIQEGSTYLFHTMFVTNYYHTVCSNWSHYIAVVTANDSVGTSWSDEQYYYEGSGVLDTWDAKDLYSPCVIKDNGEYVMFYCAKQWPATGDNPNNSIARATFSADMSTLENKTKLIDEYDIAWGNYGSNSLCSPYVVKEDNGTYTMYFDFLKYSTLYGKYIDGIYKSTSNDSLSWSTPELILSYEDILALNCGYNMNYHANPFFFKDIDEKTYLYFALYDASLNSTLARIEIKEPDDPPPPPPPPPPDDPIQATIDFDPDTLHLGSDGNPVTVYIELPDDYNVQDIVISSILLNGKVAPNPIPFEISDYDNDTIYDLKIQFDRAEVSNILEIGNKVKITVTGKVNTDDFEGYDFIKVIDPPLKVKGYPNPCKKSMGPRVLSIKVQGKLEADAVLKIYNLSGEFITEIPVKGGENAAYWYLKNKAGKYVSSGTYIYCLIVNNKVRDTGKFVVVK